METRDREKSQEKIQFLSSVFTNTSQKNICAYHKKITLWKKYFYLWRIQYTQMTAWMKKDREKTWRVCVPLALEGEDGEDRMTGLCRLLLGLYASTCLGEFAGLLWDWEFTWELDGSDFLLFL